MIKIITAQYYAIENEVNTWLEEKEGSIEVLKISHSSCSIATSAIMVTVMIEYVDLIKF